MTSAILSKHKKFHQFLAKNPFKIPTLSKFQQSLLLPFITKYLTDNGAFIVKGLGAQVTDEFLPAYIVELLCADGATIENVEKMLVEGFLERDLTYALIMDVYKLLKKLEKGKMPEELLPYEKEVKEQMQKESQNSQTEDVYLPNRKDAWQARQAVFEQKHPEKAKEKKLQEQQNKRKRNPLSRTAVPPPGAARVMMPRGMALAPSAHMMPPFGMIPHGVLPFPPPPYMMPPGVPRPAPHLHAVKEEEYSSDSSSDRNESSRSKKRSRNDLFSDDSPNCKRRRRNSPGKESPQSDKSLKQRASPTRSDRSKVPQSVTSRIPPGGPQSTMRGPPPGAVPFPPSHMMHPFGRMPMYGQPPSTSNRRAYPQKQPPRPREQNTEGGRERNPRAPGGNNAQHPEQERNNVAPANRGGRRGPTTRGAPPRTTPNNGEVQRQLPRANQQSKPSHNTPPTPPQETKPRRRRRQPSAESE